MQTELTWRRLAARERCRVCDRTGWCTVRSDGAVGCMRVQSDRPLRNGGWLHWPDGRPAAPPVVPRSGGLRSLGSAAAELAPIARRDAAYRALAAALGLDAAHRAHLVEARGLGADGLDGFASLGAEPASAALVRRVEAAAGGSLEGVPGFYRAGGRPRLVETAAGILVPVLDEVGRVRAAIVRADRPVRPTDRYRWLSSRALAALGGVGSGAPPALWRWSLAPLGVWVTEGALKAAVVAHRLDVAAVGLASVAAWRSVLPLVAELGGAPVVVAVDADWRTNPSVWRHRDEACRALVAAGAAVRVAAWPWDRGKGVDDALVVGAAVGVVPWVPSAPPWRPPRARAAGAFEPGPARALGRFEPAAASTARPRGTAS